ncbi:uroporphyrinogen decarboxylase family protein [Candidatus Sumerlaeota bacterium]
MQTSREVVDSLMRGRPAERVGLTDSPWGQTLKAWVEQGYPTNEEGNPVDPVTHFGFDMAGAGGWFAMHAKLDADEVIEETDQWKIVRNGSGAALKWWKETAGTPEHIDFLMNSREVWEKDYKPHVVGSARQRVTDEVIAGTKKALARQREVGRWSNFGHLFVWEGMRQSLGDICLYESLLADPDWIHDYCRAYTDLYLECYAILFEEAGKPDGVWMYEDMGYKDAIFCSPATFGELIFPYYREVCEFLHGHDLPVVLHTCGFTEPLLEMIVDVGFDALHPMEVKAGNDPLRIADKYGDRLALIGGLDARVLESGDRELIRTEVTKLVEGMKERGARYVFASDHSLSTSVGLADFEFGLEVYREHMMY